MDSRLSAQRGESVNPSLFSSPEYVLYRYGYPLRIFEATRPFFTALEIQRPLRVLDLGCGTGLVSRSFLNAFPIPLELHLVDVDSQMLEEARKEFADEKRVKAVMVAPSEWIPYPDASFDLVMVGSAWHWMRQPESVKEVDRLLVPGGGVHIFEYQFPRSIDHPALNEWIRSQFNSLWKPATQVPRGTLTKLTECWRSHPCYSQVASLSMTDERPHDVEELVGVVASQSRYQHFEQSLPSEVRATKRLELKHALMKWMGEDACRFSYPYEGYLFKKRR